MKKPQKQFILDLLRRRKNGATNGEIMMASYKAGRPITNPHKRVGELELDGHDIERYQEWHEPKEGRGAWLTRYWLVQEARAAA